MGVSAPPLMNEDEIDRVTIAEIVKTVKEIENKVVYLKECVNEISKTTRKDKT